MSPRFKSRLHHNKFLSYGQVGAKKKLKKCMCHLDSVKKKNEALPFQDLK